MKLGGSVAITNALVLKRCACLGMGPAFLPDWLVKTELESGALIDLFPDIEFITGDGDAAAWLVYPSRVYVPAKVRRFVEFFRAEVGSAIDSAQRPSDVPRR